MQKIATPQDLVARLRQLITYSEGRQPSRAKIATELRNLAAATEKDESDDEDAKKAFPGAAPPFKKKEAAADHFTSDVVMELNFWGGDAKTLEQQAMPIIKKLSKSSKLKRSGLQVKCSDYRQANKIIAELTKAGIETTAHGVAWGDVFR